MGKEGQWAQRSCECRGTVGTEEQWVKRDSGHRGTVVTEEQWDCGFRGTVGKEGCGHRGTVGKEGQWIQRNNRYQNKQLRTYFITIVRFRKLCNLFKIHPMNCIVNV